MNNLGESINSAAVSATPSLAGALVAWYKANAISGVNSGNALPTWTDASGYSNNATQTTPSQQPLYVANAMNGLPVVRFNSANSTYLSLSRVSTGMISPLSASIKVRRASARARPTIRGPD